MQRFFIRVSVFYTQSAVARPHLVLVPESFFYAQSVMVSLRVVPQCVFLSSPQSAVGSRQSAVGSRQSAVGSRQSAVGSPVRSPQSAVRSPQSAVRSPQSAVRSPQSAVRSPQSAVHSPQSAVRSPQSAVHVLYRPVEASSFVLSHIYHFMKQHCSCKNQWSCWKKDLNCLRDKICGS